MRPRPLMAIRVLMCRLDERPGGAVPAPEAPLADGGQQIRIERWILVHALLRITSRIAQYPRTVHEIVEAVVRMAVDPQARAAAVDQPFGVGNEARVYGRIGK